MAVKNDFIVAITQLAAERNLPRDIVLGAVEAALISAFKKDHLADRDLAVRISPQTGDVHVFARQTVIGDDEELEDPPNQLTLEEAKELRPDAEIGTVFEEEVTPANAGRIAAQTAKQVVMQRLREAERELVYAEYADKEGEVVSGIVHRFEGRSVILDLGRAEAIMPPSEQAPTERYRNGQRIKVYIVEVGKTTKGPQIVVSRTHKDLLRHLFELEVPEIFNGVVEIKALAREAGFRSKVAVAARQERVDPVGSCVGLRGVRIQNIVNELHGEKIDVLEWSADPAALISRALAPAQVMNVYIRLEEHIAVVVVPDRQLSLAIGREGQNARLAAKLTGWRIDIKSTSEAEEQRLETTLKPASAAAVAAAAAKLAPKVAAKTTTPEPVVAKAPAEAAPEPVAEPVAEKAAAPVEEKPVVVEEPVPEPVAEKTAVKQAPAPVEEKKAPSLSEALAKDETWQVPQAPQAAAPAKRSAIRFAEDIWEEQRAAGQGRDEGRSGGGGGRSKGKRRGR